MASADLTYILPIRHLIHTAPRVGEPWCRGASVRAQTAVCLCRARVVAVWQAEATWVTNGPARLKAQDLPCNPSPITYPGCLEKNETCLLICSCSLSFNYHVHVKCLLGQTLLEVVRVIK